MLSVSVFVETKNRASPSMGFSPTLVAVAPMDFSLFTPILHGGMMGV